MIIENLYYGNLCPMEDAGPDDPAYRDLNRGVLKALEELEAALTKEQMALVNQLHARISDLNCYETEAKFRYGFILGLRLMQEAAADPHFCKKGEA